LIVVVRAVARASIDAFIAARRFATMGWGVGVVAKERAREEETDARTGRNMTKIGREGLHERRKGQDSRTGSTQRVEG
jgi:NAD(P)H-hydrate repair Nnr-like enzyme with NAD(P)H-hydrate epimerase domain